MITTIHNIETVRGVVKVVIFVEGDHQLAHIYLNEKLVSQMRYMRNQDIDISLVDIIKSDLSEILIS